METAYKRVPILCCMLPLVKVNIWNGITFGLCCVMIITGILIPFEFSFMLGAVIFGGVGWLQLARVMVSGVMIFVLSAVGWARAFDASDYTGGELYK